METGNLFQSSLAVVINEGRGSLGWERVGEKWCVCIRDFSSREKEPRPQALNRGWDWELVGLLWFGPCLCYEALFCGESMPTMVTSVHFKSAFI